MELWQVIVIGFICGMLGGLIGEWIGRGRRTPIKTQDINTYVERNWGTEHQAYRRGISEGYAQGHRDCEEER